MKELDFWRGRRVLVTGHTGFKGSWLSRILVAAGAKTAGYALKPTTDPALFVQADIAKTMDSRIGDIRDFDALLSVFRDVRPEFVFHLAAQPIVLESYRDPIGTYSTNVMGTVNIMECARLTDGVHSIVNVTTDKVYENDESGRPFEETTRLDGWDPYSNSKSCSDLATGSYRRSFLAEKGTAVSTARAGNVIGGGDYAPHRIVPDCLRAFAAGRPAVIRNPSSIRPYQHVLEPLFAYLLLARRQAEDPSLAGAYNIGPDDSDCLSTGELANFLATIWGDGACCETAPSRAAPHEAGFLKLSAAKLKKTMGWEPRWNAKKALEQTCAFAKDLIRGEPAGKIMDKQIAAFMKDGAK